MPDRDPLTGVPPSRHPFQFWVLFACVLSGFRVVFIGGQPSSLESLMPSYMVGLWGWSLMIGGGLGIVAGWWPDRITGLLLERVALAAICGVTAVYGIVLNVVAGQVGAVSSSFLLSIAVASGWRIVHINRELRTLQRWMRQNFE